MSWFQIKTRCKFLAQSFHWQGIHSPFVFDLSENCFYDPKKYAYYKRIENSFKENPSKVNLKTSKFLARLIHHLKVKQALEIVDSEKKGILNWLSEEISVTQNKTVPTLLKNKKFDLIYLHNNQVGIPDYQKFKDSLSVAHNNTVFVFENIHNSKKSENSWCDIQNDPHISVSIDAFHMGLLFIRKEQVKEHFSIKIK